MTREAELLYLRDVRDLELLRYNYTKAISENNSHSNYAEKIANEANYKEIPNNSDLLTGILAVIRCIVIYLIGERWNMTWAILLPIPWAFIATQVPVNYISESLRILDIIACILYGIWVLIRNFWGNKPAGLPLPIFIIILMLVIFIEIIMPERKYRKEVKIIQLENENEKERITELKTKAINLTQKYSQMNRYIQADLNKIESMLAKAYDINIIPSQFRYNLSAMWYIYEWMSTSQSTLRDALFSAKIEEGIQRIEAKLDNIINQNNEIIFQNRMNEARQQNILNNNLQMLKRLEQINENTIEAGYYAKVASVYSQVSAFFSTVDYFQK